MTTVNKLVIKGALDLSDQPAWKLNFVQRRWRSIVDGAEKSQNRQRQCLTDSCIVGFGAESTLPKDVARVVSSYINTPINAVSLSAVIRLVTFLERQEELRTGRGGDGMRTTEKYIIKTQLPRLLFSQNEFLCEIRNRAGTQLFRRLHLRGTAKEQLSMFFLILMNEL